MLHVFPKHSNFFISTPTTTIRLWYRYQTNTFSIYLKLMTSFITHCCWHDQNLLITANIMFIKLPNNYFQCKLHLIAIILHLNDFLNLPTVFVCINAFQTYISKFMMILLVYVLVGFQFLRKKPKSNAKRNLLLMNILL